MDKHPIGPVLEHYGSEIQPERMGWVKIRCPFHGDSHASAVVNYQENCFKCFACSVAGDTYSIIMQQEGVDFREAFTIASTISGTSGSSISAKRRGSHSVSGTEGIRTRTRSYVPPRGRRATNGRP